MKKKEKGKIIDKKKAPKGTERGTKSERGKKEPEKKEEKISKKQPSKKIEKEVKEEVKKEEKEKIPKRKIVKKIEKIAFPPKKEEVLEKKKKPKFIREEFYMRKKLKEKWRRPRGLDSKKHLEKRGKGKPPKIGYKNREIGRGLVGGLMPKHVYNPTQLGTISKEEGVIISGNVGRKKRNEIIKEANKLKLTILNPRKGEV